MKWISAMLVLIALEARGGVISRPTWSISFSRSLSFSWRNKGEAREDSRQVELPEDVPSCPTCVFNSGNLTVIVNGRKCGQEFNVKDFTEAPLVKWNGADNKKTKYTFLLTGMANRISWLVSNIPGNVLKSDGNITGFNQLTDYRAPLTPKKGSHSLCRAHIYLQSHNIPTNIRIDSPEMDNFDKRKIAEFVKKHELKGPLGGVQTWAMRDIPRH